MPIRKDERYVRSQSGWNLPRSRMHWNLQGCRAVVPIARNADRVAIFETQTRHLFRYLQWIARAQNGAGRPLDYKTASKTIKGNWNIGTLCHHIIIHTDRSTSAETTVRQRFRENVSPVAV